MNLEYFIARRIERESKNLEPSVMMRVATLSVALGIVVMIITIAIIGGFKSEINSKLSGLSGHIIVTNVRGVDSALPILDSKRLTELIGSTGEVERESAYILRGAIARGGGVIEGVMVKGVDSAYNAPFFERFLVEGVAPRFGVEGESSRREVLISQDLAGDMNLDVGGGIELLLSDEDEYINRFRFKVAGIFSIGVGEAEKRVVIADIETMRKINGWGEDQISGREITISDIGDADRVAEELNKKIIFALDSELEYIASFSIGRIYPSLFDWLKTHDINGVVVVVIMLIVALFNMIVALLILVLERTQMIGILKSLGMGNESLQRIFLYRALGVITRGVVCGNVVALTLCAIQSHWGVIKLEASGYMLSVVPIELKLWWIVALNVGAVGVILAVMTIPTRIVATINPDEIVKYK